MKYQGVLKYLCAGLCAAMLLLGWFYREAHLELQGTKTALAVAEGVNKANAEAIARLERSVEITDTVLAGWNEDRTTLAGIRSAARQAIKEAMRDETFKNWASGAVPADAWRVLHEAPGADTGSSDTSRASGGAAGPVPGVPGPGGRVQW